MLSRLYAEGGGIRSSPRSRSAPHCWDSVGKAPFREKETALRPITGWHGRYMWLAREPGLQSYGSIVSIVQTSGTVADNTEHPMALQFW